MDSTPPLSITWAWNEGGPPISWRISPDTHAIEGLEVPTWIEATIPAEGAPDLFVRIEIRDDAPRVVALSFIAQADQGEVQEKHLRKVHVDQLATDLLAPWVSEQLSDPDVLAFWTSKGLVIPTMARPEPGEPAQRAARKVFERQRLPPEYRRIDNEFLQQVAQVYRENIGHAPTAAVAEAFSVGYRTAVTYVDKARGKGYLPPTKQGRKKA